MLKTTATPHLKGKTHPLLPFTFITTGSSSARMKMVSKRKCKIYTKKNIIGYVGEKGIGFKSVFKMARKVHIQSGSFSFAFEYDPDGVDSGLGMVTPLLADYLDLPPKVNTRMILDLQAGCDKKALRKEFDNLPETLLLFLRKLRILKLRIRQANGTDVETTYSMTTQGNHARINRKCGQKSSNSLFWIARKVATSMPEHSA